MRVFEEVLIFDVEKLFGFLNGSDVCVLDVFFGDIFGCLMNKFCFEDFYLVFG